MPRTAKELDWYSLVKLTEMVRGGYTIKQISEELEVRAQSGAHHYDVVAYLLFAVLVADLGVCAEAYT
jgi:hypothetical protein